MLDFDFTKDKKLDFYLKNYRIALDIDEVLCDFIGGYQRKYGSQRIVNWHFSYDTSKIVNELKDDKEFWLNLNPKVSHLDIPFIPICYISKRNFHVSWTEEWLEKNHFPCVPVVHVEDDKTEACKAWKIDIFADDSIINFQRLNKNGTKTFLVDGPHNKQFDVGDYRIMHLKDIILKV